MKRIPSKTRVELILAGIREIRVHGIQNFSVRRIAADCGVSCSAPYKHFKNKNDYILAILHYINEQWHQVERQILADPPDSLREQLVRISIAYIRFLQENPHYRAHYHAAGREPQSGADSGEVQPQRLRPPAGAALLPEHGDVREGPPAQDLRGAAPLFTALPS